jgi:hypothetical protein
MSTFNKVANLKDRISLIAQYSDEDLLFALHYYGTEEEKKQLFKKERLMSSQLG